MVLGSNAELVNISTKTLIPISSIAISSSQLCIRLTANLSFILINKKTLCKRISLKRPTKLDLKNLTLWGRFTLITKSFLCNTSYSIIKNYKKYYLYYTANKLPSRNSYSGMLIIRKVIQCFCHTDYLVYKFNDCLHSLFLLPGYFQGGAAHITSLGYGIVNL